MNRNIGDHRFVNKHIVITGAGGNFGQEGCIFFCLRGARVTALDNNLVTLNETVSLVHKRVLDSGGDVSVCDIPIQSFVCDVTSVSSVHEVLEQAVQSFGTPDLLWNNAGYQGQIQPTLTYSPEDFALVMNVNVTGMFIVLQAVAKYMAEASASTSSGDNSIPFRYSIVNTASVAALRGTPAMVAYSASKAAVLAMTVSSAKDLAPYGIRVNAISPALIGPGYMWNRQNELHALSGSPYFPTDPVQVANAKISSVPMKRLGSVEEVIQSVAFLLSDESSYTTAFNLVIDGGLSGGLH